MKVGILSMQRVYNHGSFLQSYSLKMVLEKLGFEVRFVDISFGEKIYNEPPISRKRSFFLKHFLKKVNHVLFNYSKNKRFEKKYFRISGINNPAKENECDFIVVGSDEVFNFYQNSPWGLTDQLFGRTSKPTISYAGSFGNTDYLKIQELGLVERLKNDMSMFRAVSVRDDNSFDCVKKLLGINPTINLDPVFIYDYMQEQNSVQNIKFNDYIAIYCYDNGINDNESIRQIREFAKKHNKKILSLGFYNQWCDYNLICSPFELLVYFKNAYCVITDTFHGAVISIKQNKPFLTLVRKHNKNKLGDLLKRFGLESRIIEGCDNLDDRMFSQIDYERINAFIQCEKEKAIDYLNKNIR